MTSDLPALECIEQEPPGEAARHRHLAARPRRGRPRLRGRWVPMLEARTPLRFVFPHAPVRPVTINGGAEMRAWYDIDPRAPTSGTEDIARSAAQVQALVDAQAARGTPPERIVLAGFSQGGVIALHMGTRASQPFAGIMGPLHLRTRPGRAAGPGHFRQRRHADLHGARPHGPDDPPSPVLSPRATPSKPSTTASSGASTAWVTRCAPKNSPTSVAGSTACSARPIDAEKLGPVSCIAGPTRDGTSPPYGKHAQHHSVTGAAS